MKIWMIALVVFAVVASGCSKKDNNTVASPTAGVNVQPSPGASTTPSGTNAGGAVTASATTPKASTNGEPAETTSTITKEQVEKITMTSTYDDLVKQTGSKREASERGEWKTYV